MAGTERLNYRYPNSSNNSKWIALLHIVHGFVPVETGMTVKSMHHGLCATVTIKLLTNYTINGIWLILNVWANTVVACENIAGIPNQLDSK